MKKELSMAAVFLTTVLSSSLAFAEDVDVKVCVQVVERSNIGSKNGAQKEKSKSDSDSEETKTAVTKTDEETQEQKGDATNEMEKEEPTSVFGENKEKQPVNIVKPVLKPNPLTKNDTSGVEDAENPKDRSYYAQRNRRFALNLDTNLPIGQTSQVYLKRLIEYFITHETGYVAVEEGCSETLTVELYPLKEGWTAFARYSGTGREERVDQLFPNELSPFAERAVLALLRDVPLSATINRENVLKSDSQKSIQRIKGSNHFVLSLGTQLRAGWISSIVEDGEDKGNSKERLRFFSPLKAALGYRGRFESWGLEAMTHIGIGTSKKSASKNPEGGHIDLGGDTGMGVRFLRFFDPRGLTSFYLGAGGTFELLWFHAIKAEEKRYDETRSTLFSGGIDVDLVFGWEFMRAAAVQFYLQGELNLPAYAVQSEDSAGSIDTWFPGASLKLGVVF